MKKPRRVVVELELDTTLSVIELRKKALWEGLLYDEDDNITIIQAQANVIQKT
jgi:hypothetical protein